MYKTITLSEAASKEYDNYKLCYVDEINKTYSDWTPETLEYMKSDEYREYEEERERIRRETPSGHPIPWCDNPQLELQDYPNPDYVRGKQEFYAYFTPIELKDQWGDDWDDAPYEHNAGKPYDDIYEESNRIEYGILQVPFYVGRYGWGVRFPEDWGQYGNSPFCVRDVNSGAVAWIFASGPQRKEISGIAVHAGINPREFVEKVAAINKMYPYIPEEDEDD
jgi:hypothetical protein